MHDETSAMLAGPSLLCNIFAIAKAACDVIVQTVSRDCPLSLVSRALNRPRRTPCRSSAQSHKNAHIPICDALKNYTTDLS